MSGLVSWLGFRLGSVSGLVSWLGLGLGLVFRRPVRRGGSLGANEPPFEMSFEKKNKATTVNELSFYNR